MKTLVPVLFRAKGYPTVKLYQNLLISPGTVVEDFEDKTSFTQVSSPSVGTLTDNTVNYKTGSKSMKFLTPASAGYIQGTKGINAVCDGNIRFWVYCADTVSPSDMVIMFGNETPAWTNYFEIYKNAGGLLYRHMPGWNLMDIKTTDWSVGAGAPSWANPIRQIRFKLMTAANAHEYSMDSLYFNVLPQPVIVLTFDDGVISQYTEAFNYLSLHKSKSTIFAISGLVDLGGYVTTAQLQEMYAAGWSVSNHTDNTTDLSTLTETQQETAISNCDTFLSGIGIGDCRKHVAYPGGGHNDDTLVAMANLGMFTGRTVVTSTKEEKLPMGFPHHLYVLGSPISTTALATVEGWVDIAKARNLAGIIYIHGLSGAPAGGDWYIDRFESLVAYIIAQGLPIVTMQNLYELQSGSMRIPRGKA